AGNAQVNLDLPNISLSRRNQLDPIAVGIGQFKRHRDAGIGNGESLVSAAWASWWQGVAGVVDLKYRAEQAIAMLLHSAAQAQEFLVAGYGPRPVTSETALVYKDERRKAPADRDRALLGACESPFGSVVHGVSRQHHW